MTIVKFISNTTNNLEKYDKTNKKNHKTIRYTDLMIFY